MSYEAIQSMKMLVFMVAVICYLSVIMYRLKMIQQILEEIKEKRNEL